MNEQAYEQLTLFPADSLVNPSPWLESKKVKGTTAIFGRKCSELSANCARVGLLVRTWLESCELPLPTLFRTWSVKAIASSCLILKLRLSERRTDGSESHLWATPNVMDSLPQRSPESLLKMAEGARKGRTRPSNLREQVDEDTMRLWPTPTVYGNNQAPESSPKAGTGLATAAKLWPTPTVQNAKGPSQTTSRQGAEDLQTAVLWPTPRASDGEHGGPNQRDGNGSARLPMLAAMFPTPTARDHFPPHSKEYIARKKAEGHGMSLLNNKIGGSLNPNWVEWLMGYPSGWTDIGDQNPKSPESRGV